MSKIGVGIIGAGSIADIGHCPSIEALPNAYLAALCDTNTEFLDKMSRKWNPKKTYVDYHDMLEDKNVQVVIVGTPNRLHAQEAIDAMRAKKHVIVEKPFACTHAEAWKMVDVCHEEGVFLMAGTNQLFWEQNMIARKLMPRCTRAGRSIMSSFPSRVSARTRMKRARALCLILARTARIF